MTSILEFMKSFSFLVKFIFSETATKNKKKQGGSFSKRNWFSQDTWILLFKTCYSLVNLQEKYFIGWCVIWLVHDFVKLDRVNQKFENCINIWYKIKKRSKSLNHNNFWVDFLGEVSSFCFQSRSESKLINYNNSAIRSLSTS